MARMGNRVWLLAATLVLACGSSSGGGDPAAAFAGTWKFDSGSIKSTCTGVTIADVDLTGVDFNLTRTDGTHIALVSTSGIICNVTFNVGGSTATVAAGQSCMIPVGSVGGVTLGNVTVAINSWTLAISDGSLSSNMSGTVSAVIVTCTPTSTGTLSRSSDAGA